MKRALTILLALLLLTCAARAETPARTITVRSEATVSMEADTATLSLGVQTEDKRVTRALTDNAARIQAVTAALESLGIAAEDISASRFRINTQYSYSSALPKLSGFTVSSGLSVTLRDPAMAGQAIDAAFDAGANQCDGISVSAADPQSGRDAALLAAIEEGRRRAELIAAANGETLGVLLSVDSQSAAQERSTFTGDGVTNFAYGTQIVADGVSFTASVTLVFAIVDAE